MPEFDGLDIRIGADIGDLLLNMRKATQSIDGFDRGSSKLDKLGRVFRRLAPPALKFAELGIDAGKAVFEIGRRSLETADALQTVSNHLRINVESLQGLRASANQVGVDQGTLDGALKQFSERIAQATQGSGDLARMLDGFGISINDAAGKTRPTIEIIKDLAEKTASAGTEQDKLKILFAAFGEQASDLLPLFRDGSSGLETMNKRWRDLGLILSEDVVGPLADSKSNIDLFLDAMNSQATSVIGIFGKNIESLSEKLLEFATFTQKVVLSITTSFTEIENQSRDQLKFTLTELAEEQAELQKDLEEAKKSAAKQQNTIGQGFESTNVNKLERAIRDIEEKIERAKRSLSEFTESAGEQFPPRLPGLDQNTVTATGIPGLNAQHERQIAQLQTQLDQECRVQLDLQKEEIEQAQEDALAKLKELGELEISLRAELSELRIQLEKQTKEKIGEIQGDSSELEEVLAREATLQKELAELRIEFEERIQGKIKGIRKDAAENDKSDNERRLAELQSDLRNALESVQTKLSGVFNDVFSGAITSFDEAADAMKSIGVRLASDLADILVVRPTIDLAASGLNILLGGGAGVAGGGTASGGGGVTGGLSLASSAAQLSGFNPLSGAFSGIGQSINNFGASIGFGAANTTGFAAGVASPAELTALVQNAGTLTPATLTSVLGAAGVGALGGGILASLTGGSQLGCSIGGGLGAGAGFALESLTPLGPIGGALLGGVLGGAGGGFLGGLFGKKKKPNKGPGAQVDLGISGGPNQFRAILPIRRRRHKRRSTACRAGPSRDQRDSGSVRFVPCRRWRARWPAVAFLGSRRWQWPRGRLFYRCLQSKNGLSKRRRRG